MHNQKAMVVLKNGFVKFQLEEKPIWNDFLSVYKHYSFTLINT